MEAYRRLDVGPRSGQLERHGAAEAEADRGDTAGIDLRPCRQRREAGAGAGPGPRRVGEQRLQQADRLLQLVDQPAVAVQVAGQRDIAHAPRAARPARWRARRARTPRGTPARRAAGRRRARRTAGSAWSGRRPHRSVSRGASMSPGIWWNRQPLSEPRRHVHISGMWPGVAGGRDDGTEPPGAALAGSGPIASTGSILSGAAAMMAAWRRAARPRPHLARWKPPAMKTSEYKEPHHGRAAAPSRDPDDGPRLRARLCPRAP